MDGTRLAAGCFDGTVVVWHYNNSDTSLIPFQAKEHNLAVFAVIWNRWNRNLFASRSRDEVFTNYRFLVYVTRCQFSFTALG